MMEPSPRSRIVCIGDSITDGYTYGQLIMQALRDAGRPQPVVICAGVASHTAPQMAARFERDALGFQPELVIFSSGTNDALRGVSAEQYETALRQIADQCKARGIRMMLQTPCIMNERGANKPREAADAMGDKFEGIIRAVAEEHGWPVAQTRRLQKQARAADQQIMVFDGLHPNYLGQSLMARAILDALGQTEVPLPERFLPELFAGVVREWKMKLAPVVDGQPRPLDEATVARLRTDETWTTYTLPDLVPENKPTAEDWREQCRRNGYALRVKEVVGKGMIYAAATIPGDPSGEPGKAWINTASGVQRVYLNGKLVYTHPQQADGRDLWTGFHAGKERIEVTLLPGPNALVVQHAGGDFFVSVTPKLVWEEDVRFGR